MGYRLLKDCVEFPVAHLFASNWLAVCRDKSYSVASLLRSIGQRRDYVHTIRNGTYSNQLKVYSFQLLSDLIGLSVVEVLTYKPILKVGEKYRKDGTIYQVSPKSK
jgi:hypothetical protein